MNSKSLNTFPSLFFIYPAFYILFLFAFFSTNTLTAQEPERAYNWYFGDASINFPAGGTPVVTNNSSMTPTIPTAPAGTASISDLSGNLLFYTNSQTIWDKTGTPMPNGIVMGTPANQYQSVLIVPFPGSTSRYYVFHIENVAGTGILRYSVVDMALNGGFGDVVPAQKNVLLYNQSSFRISGVRHCNNKDYWVITHENSTNKFRVFLVSAAGVTPISPALNTVGNSLIGTIPSGVLKVSPSGTKVALCGRALNSMVELFDFNNQTGILSNPIAINARNWSCGIEFSQNGSKLYVSQFANLGFAPDETYIDQYDICAGNAAAINASKNTIAQLIAIHIPNMQLAPDGKIYCARTDKGGNTKTVIGAISNPDALGAAYTDNALNIAPKTCRYGLPNFVQSFFEPTLEFTTAANCRTVNFTPPVSTCSNAVNIVKWDFGDPNATVATATSTQTNPSHTYALSGQYTVSLYLQCDTITQVVNVQACPLVVNANNAAVCPGSNAIISVTVTGGSPFPVNYNYQWSPNIGNGPGPYPQNPNVTTVYTVTVTDGDNTKAVRSITVNVSPVTVSNISDVDMLCSGGGNNGQASVNPAGAAPYTYLWSTNSTASGISNLSAGVYTVTMTDANGCKSTATTTITAPPVLTATNVINSPISCFNANDGAVTINAGGGTPGYAYVWPGGQITNVANNLSPGPYSVTVTDANLCKAVANFTLTQPNPLNTGVVNVANVLCYNLGNGVITTATNGGAAPFVYSWSGTTQTTAIVSGLTAGNYSYTVTDANGCKANSAAVVTQPNAPLSSTITVLNNPTCNGGNNGSASVVASGGTPNMAGLYNYLWQPSNQVTPIATGLNALQAYTVTVIDQNLCTYSNTVALVQPTLAITATVVVANTTCHGDNDGQITINVSGGTPFILPASGTLYYNYQWSTTATDVSINNIPAGTYSATVTDALGCIVTATATVIEPPAINPNVVLHNDVSCKFGNDGMLGTNAIGGNNGGYNYLWSPTGQIGANATNLSAGMYSVTVTDSKGCTGIAAKQVNEPLLPLTVAVNSVDVLCHGQSTGQANANANGGNSNYQYHWSNNILGPNNNNIGADTYTVTVIDSKGCVATETTTVSEPAQALVVNSVAQQTVSCNGLNDGAAMVVVNGGTPDINPLTPYVYSWMPGNYNTQVINNLIAGVYNVTVTDANGCKATSLVNIPEPMPIQINITAPISICLGTNTNLTASASNGSAPYQYNWSSAQAGNSISVAPNTTTSYTLTITDDNNCVATATTSVVVSNPLVLVMQPNVSVCKGSNITLASAVAGGLGAYNYNWTPGALNTSSISVSPANTGIYTLEVTNTCGVVSGTVEVTVNQLPIVTFSVDAPSGCPQHCVILTNTTANTQQALWDFGDGSQGNGAAANHCYANSGNYDVTLTVTDFNGCSDTQASVGYITVYPVPLAQFVATPQTTTILEPTVLFTDQSLNATSWLWSFGDANNTTSTDQHPKFDYNDPGTYTVTLDVANAHGCTTSLATLDIIVLEDYVLYVPNGFTPNGDGHNDVFLPQGMGMDPDHYELWIYDRWGKMIFNTRNISVGWDGIVQGGDSNLPVQQDTYVWVIKVKDITTGKLRNLAGSVSVLK